MNNKDILEFLCLTITCGTVHRTISIGVIHKSFETHIKNMQIVIISRFEEW